MKIAILFHISNVEKPKNDKKMVAYLLVCNMTLTKASWSQKFHKIQTLIKRVVHIVEKFNHESRNAPEAF